MGKLVSFFPKKAACRNLPSLTLNSEILLDEKFESQSIYPVTTVCGQVRFFSESYHDLITRICSS